MKRILADLPTIAILPLDPDPLPVDRRTKERASTCAAKIVAAMTARRREWTENELGWIICSNFTPEERRLALGTLVGLGKLSLESRYQPAAKDGLTRVYTLTPLATTGGEP